MSMNELTPVKPAEGASPVPNTAKHSPLDKLAQPKMALPGVRSQHKPSPVTADFGSQSHSIPGNHVSNPLPNPTSGTEVARRDLAATSKGSDVPQASATNLNLNDDKENVTSGLGIPEDRQETALAGEIKEIEFLLAQMPAFLNQRLCQFGKCSKSLVLW